VDGVRPQERQGERRHRLLLNLSLDPLIVVIISIAALIFGREGVPRESAQGSAAGSARKAG
jgi:hypothetical protein